MTRFKNNPGIFYVYRITEIFARAKMSDFAILAIILRFCQKNCDVGNNLNIVIFFFAMLAIIIIFILRSCAFSQIQLYVFLIIMTLFL